MSGGGHFLHAPIRNGRGASGQVTETGRLELQVIRTLGLACNDGLVGHGLIGVPSQGTYDGICKIDANTEARPAVMGLPVNAELQTQIALCDIDPIAGLKERLLAVDQEAGGSSPPSCTR